LVGEDGETDAHGRVPLRFEIVEERIERGDDRDPLVLLIHAARAIERDEHVDRLARGARCGGGAPGFEEPFGVLEVAHAAVTVAVAEEAPRVVAVAVLSERAVVTRASTAV